MKLFITILVEALTMEEKFCLKWNDFHSVVSKSYGMFRNEDYLHDVTLVSDDQHQVSAHKLVLSACSQYFKNVFKNNTKHSHPLICLGGVSSKLLSMMMDYVYNGEVQIFKEDLDLFLDTAQRFKIEGLLRSDNKEKSLKMENEENLQASEANHVEEFTAMDTTPHAAMPEEKKIVVTNSQDLHQIRADVKKYTEKLSDGTYKCAICGKTSNQLSHIKTHIETHIEGLEFPCQVCEKIFRSRPALRNHKLAKHRL